MAWLPFQKLDLTFQKLKNWWEIRQKIWYNFNSLYYKGSISWKFCSAIAPDAQIFDWFFGKKVECKKCFWRSTSSPEKAVKKLGARCNRWIQVFKKFTPGCVMKVASHFRKCLLPSFRRRKKCFLQLLCTFVHWDYF